MKKNIFFLGLAALALAACSGNPYEDWADPQHSDPETAKDVTLSIANAADIDFGTLSTDSVQIFVPTVTTDNVSETTNSYTVELYNEDKSASNTLQADAQGRVLASDFKTAIEGLYGKAPKTHDVAMDIQGFAATSDGVTIKHTGSATSKVTVVAPFIDEGGYYLVGDMFNSADGNVSGWSKDGAQAFTHQGTGSVYDAPEFTIVFKTTADNQYWKVIPANNYNGEFWKEAEDGVVGTAVNGDDALDGNLTTNQPQAGKIEKAGIYRMTLNMMNYTYKLEKLNFQEYLYAIGNVNGDSWSKVFPLWGGNFDGKYVGYYYLGKEFKVRGNAGDWNSTINIGLDDSGKLISDGDSKNITGYTPNQFYKIELDQAAMTYTLTPITKMGIIGDFNSWGGDIEMTYNTSENCWEAKGVALSGGVKFRANGGWDINWGGDTKNLTEKGDNINVDAGTYDVKLFVSYTGNNHCTFTKK